MCRKQLSVDLFSQLSAWPETDCLPFFNGDGLSGAGVPPVPRRLAANRKGAEVHDLDRFSRQQCLLHGIEDGIDNIGAAALGKAESFGNGLGQFSSGQVG
jgi:hypothetical protein